MKIFIVLMFYEDSTDFSVYDEKERAQKLYNELIGNVALFEMTINDYNSKTLLASK